MTNNPSKPVLYKELSLAVLKGTSDRFDRMRNSATKAKNVGAASVNNFAFMTGTSEMSTGYGPNRVKLSEE
ncbi:hypothetical protein AB6A40_003220 [Gnathostoma spinigerum]|uniref:Uncharacterized protein n=1 Tax=Gnathostoma spinigerum TaxID=75299 RepID=A0ABD6EGK1_9BILA